MVTSRFITRQASELVEIEIEGGEILTGTPLHPIWITELQDWVDLDKVEVGHSVWAERGPLKIVSKRFLSTGESVYNLEVYGEHLYLVTEVGVLVHNAKSCVSSGTGRVHVTYTGMKDGKPYVGYASAPKSKASTPQEVIDYRYNKDFSGFTEKPKPVPGTYGEGKAGKAKARGTEQKIHQENVEKHGKDGVANKQNPVGPNNPRRDEYMNAAGGTYNPNPGGGS